MANETSKGKVSSLFVTMCSSLIGVLVGAFLQYFLTLKTQDARLWSELRTRAYIQYVENSTKFNSLRNEQTDPVKLAETRALMNSSRYLIALYGSKGVVEKMELYTQWENQPGSDDFRTAARELFTAMRNDLLPGSDAVPAEQLGPILFPSQVETKQSR